MNILHVVHQYLPQWVGGVEIYTQQVAQAMQSAGHTVAIFVREDQPGGWQVTEEAGVRVYRFAGGARSEPQRWLAALRDPATHAAFERTLQHFRPEVVHLQHLLGLPVSVLAALRQRHLPHLMTLHDYSLLCANTKLLTNGSEHLCTGPQAYLNCGQCGAAKAGWPPAFAPALAPVFALRAAPLRRVLRRVPHFIAPTAFVRQTHVRLGAPADRVQVLDYGINLPADPPVPVRPAGPLRVAFLGSVARLKGVHVLLQAFNTLPAEAELRVAGPLDREPAYVADLRASAHHPNIHFLGALDRAQTQALMDWADVVAVPSIWYEVSPLVIHEARARQRPVLVGDFGSAAGLVEPGGDGWRVSPHTAPAWAAALHDLHLNRAKLLAAHARVRPPKTTADHVRELLAVYAGLLA